MLDDQNTPDIGVPEQAAAPGPRRDVPCTQDATSDGHGSTVWGIHRDGARRLNYRDYYWMTSLADFLAWVQKDDGNAPPISFSET